jgi:hypothetical protein
MADYARASVTCIVSRLGFGRSLYRLVDPAGGYLRLITSFGIRPPCNRRLLGCTDIDLRLL